MHSVSRADEYPVQLTVTPPPPGLRARMWVAPEPLLAAVAVFTPVAPALAWSCSSMPRATACAPRSTRSVIPAGGVHWFEIPVAAPTANEATTMALATVVVMLGVEWVELLAVAWPVSALIGEGLSDPEYATIAPAMLCEPLPGVNAQS